MTNATPPSTTGEGANRQERRHAQVSQGAVGRFVRQMFRAYGQSLAPAVQKDYVEALRSVPLGFLRAFHEAEIKRRDPKTQGPPNPEEIATQWREHGEDYLNPEVVLDIEIPVIREQIKQLIAFRVGMTEDMCPPLDGVRVPKWVKRIVTQLAGEARKAYPDGVPTDRQKAVVSSYQKRARLLFDEEIARQFNLQPPVPQRDMGDLF